MNDNIQFKHSEVLRLVVKINIDMLDFIIEDMINGDQGKGRSKYKSAVQYLNGVKTHYQLAAAKAGIKIPEKDVLRKSECVPTQTEGNGFIRHFLMEFVAFFLFIAGLASMFILIWAAVG